MISNVIKSFEKAVINNWTSTAIVDNNVDGITYSELARQIVRMQLLWELCGLKKGDKISIIAHNCAQWVEVYMAIISSGYSAVILSPSLSKSDMRDLLIHSDTRIIYCDGGIDTLPDPNTIPLLLSVIDILNNQILFSNKNYDPVIINANLRSQSIVNNGISKDSVHFNNVGIDDIHTIIYTSGTKGTPKGAMHSIAFSNSQINCILKEFIYKKGECSICICPFYHVFGITTDVVVSLCTGMTVVIPNSIIPEDLITCMREYRPRNIFIVPMILQKIVETILKVELNFNDFMDITFLLSQDIVMYQQIAEKLISDFGGNIETVTVGGASIPTWLEKLLIEKMHFPLITIYGSTECGLVSKSKSSDQKIGSCGKLIDPDSVRILSNGISHHNDTTIGEVQIRGNIFYGYYNNSFANETSFSNDGWFLTGDLGYIDEDGYLFLTGRCKDMLLTSNGENIFPEEVEGAMDASPYIKESVLTQRGEKLHAIVVPDREKAEADGLDAEGLNKKIDEAVREASKKLPGFTIISGFELRDEPLERTPKGSLKRYLYSDGIKEN